MTPKTKKSKKPKKAPFMNGRKRRIAKGAATTADRYTEPDALGAPPRPLARTGARTIACKICKLPIEFSTGLDEMAAHWEEEHPEALAKLRRKLGHDQRDPREVW